MKRALTGIGGAVAAATVFYGGYVAITYLRFGRAGCKARGIRCSTGSCRSTTSASATLSPSRRPPRSRSPPRETSRSGVAHRQSHPRAPSAAGAASGGSRSTHRAPTLILDEVIALGWRQLGETAERRILMAAVTQPWRQQVRFHGLPAEEFVAFRQPGYAKIVWTIEVEPVGRSSSVFSTETRVATTDPTAANASAAIGRSCHPVIASFATRRSGLSGPRPSGVTMCGSRSSRARSIRSDA